MKKHKTISKLLGLSTPLFFLLCAFVVTDAQVIYDNGGLTTGATTKSGVAAPAGTQWSEVQNNNFETTSSNTLAGVGCQVIGAATNNRCADDFMVPVGETWTISSVVTFAYQTGFAGGVSPIVGANLRIWNGFPEAPGSTIVFGDTTTNRLTSSTNSLLFRVFNTTIPAPGTAPGTTRIIWQNTITVSPSAVLGPGHYWVDFQMDSGATTGNFAPTITTPGTRGAMVYNAVQKIGAAAFIPIIEAGNPAAAVDYSVDFPFKLNGSIAGTIGTRRSRTVDFNGDNKTDFAIARSASAGAQTTWSIFDSAGGTSGIAWGLGVGFAGGDIATPEDFDGDGKTDIAVWRSGAPNTAAFYILRSATNTVNIQVFGQTGDNPRVVDDYDGDGLADVAVYRDGGGGQSFFFYRGTLSNPGGNITYAPWGIGGDKPAPGDYDGDRKADFAVIRNEGGLARHFHSRTTQGFVTVQFGLFTDTFAPGDYDGDNKTDICMVRTSTPSYQWNVLRSSNGVAFSTFVLGGFGATGDIIVQGDYDGDNRTDFAVWRTSATNNGVFYLAPTNTQVSGTKWGTSPSDYPVANYNAF